MHNATVTPLSPPTTPPGSEQSYCKGPAAAPQTKALLTPPPSQPGLKTRQAHASNLKIPPTPESRIGIFLGKSLQLKGILGTGAYGVVYSAFDYSSYAWYAVKALSKFNPNGEPLDRRQREFQSREIQLHYAASAHPNIVSMLKIVDDPDCTYVILEYCPEGDLFSNITERGLYVSNDALVQRAFLQILDAVEHCHRLGIYHRDLKPENILVSNSGHDVLLADFGLATTDSLSEDHECLDQSSRKPSYRCAPNDVWSLGVILVNLTCGRNPWKQASDEDSTYRAFKKDKNFLKSILPLSDELNDILGMIFESNPKERITVSQLKQLIFHCPSFSSPPQPQYQIATPPQSPQADQFDVSSISSNDSQYTLPPQEFHGNFYAKPSPCYQAWGYEHPYETYNAIPRAQPAILHHPSIFSPYSYP
ncbi:putative negative regulator of sexual conjugation and meiosis [Halenospora varia]|nr:putative negative regulator of sexual conjugation and meiosis [Halenospora varia]